MTKAAIVGLFNDVGEISIRPHIMDYCGGEPAFVDAPRQFKLQYRTLAFGEVSLRIIEKYP